MNINFDPTPYLLVLGIVGASCALVYIAATVYYRWKQNRFWDSFDAEGDDEPTTDEERAAMSLWNMPEGSVVEFVDPEGDPAAEPAEGPVGKVEVAKDAAEMVALFAAKQRAAAQQTMDYDRIPTGQVFTDLNGRSYKFVENPRFGEYPGAPKRSKISVGGFVSNPNAIPTPSLAEMAAITKRQAVETVENVDGNILSVQPDDDTCEICGVGTDHGHSGGEVRRVIGERAEAKFKTYVANLDLTKLPAEEVMSLWSRCKLRLETDAAQAAMEQMDNLFARARKLAEEDAEDEAFYKAVCKEAEAGPINVAPPTAVLDTLHPKTCGFEVPHYAPCTRDYGHEGPCAMPLYTKYCGNCTDLFPEDRAVENCGCGFDISDKPVSVTVDGADEEEGEMPSCGDVECCPVGEKCEEKLPEQSVPIEMPKRFMSGITHQISEEASYEGLKLFGDELADQIVEKDEKHKAYGAVGQLMEKLQKDTKEHFVEVYSKLDNDELDKRASAMLQVAQERARAEKKAKAKKKPAKKAAKKSRRK